VKPELPFAKQPKNDKHTALKEYFHPHKDLVGVDKSLISALNLQVFK